MIIAPLTILIAIAGALIYALSNNGKVAQLGFAMFCVGLFWAVYFAGKVHISF